MLILLLLIIIIIIITIITIIITITSTTIITITVIARYIRVQLDSFVKLIANTMATRFLDLAVSMNNALFLEAGDAPSGGGGGDSGDGGSSGSGGGGSGTEAQLQLSRRVAFKENILPLVKGLVRVGQLRQVMAK